MFIKAKLPLKGISVPFSKNVAHVNADAQACGHAGEQANCF